MPNSKTSTGLVQMGPIMQLRAGKLCRRFIQLIVGLSLFGLSISMMIRGNLGVAPWDALHVGLTEHLPMSFGTVVVIVSFLVLLIWVPLREMPGIGTLANAILIGVVADIGLNYIAAPDAMTERLILTVGGVLVCGLGSALYIGAQFGRGPRDGLMTGFNRVTGYPLWLVRTVLEVLVLLAGIWLSGLHVLGIGTLLFALFIGPLTQLMLPWALVKIKTE